MRVEYHPALAAELAAVRDHYEALSPGLGRGFVDEFEQQVQRMATAPERWLVVAPGLRRCLMKRFPYVIYFRVLGEEHIRVTVVKHQRRHPLLGRERR